MVVVIHRRKRTVTVLSFTSSSRYMACLRWMSGIFSLHDRRAKSKAKSKELSTGDKAPNHTRFPFFIFHSDALYE